MSDPREEFLQKVQMMITGKVDRNTETMITAVVRIAASNYEITERCTEVATTGDMNNELLMQYKASLIIEGKRPKTIDHYIYQLNKFIDTVGKDFRNVTTSDIKLFMAKRKYDGIASATIDNERAALSAFYAWLLNEDWIEKDPTAKIKKVKYQRVEKNAFSDIEVAMIRDAAAGLRERAMVEFLLSSGVRVEELATMLQSDVKDDLSVVVRDGKGGKHRVTYISPSCAMYLKKYIASRSDNDPHLFVSKTKSGPLDTDSIREILHGLEEPAGVKDIHPHRFRHTFATDLDRRGVPVTTIQRLLGHTSLNTTMMYINQSQDKVQQDYKRAI